MTKGVSYERKCDACGKTFNYIVLYERDAPKLCADCDALKEEEMGIPTLPKKEVPEVGYRIIRDWVIDNLGDELDGEKTTSEIVVEMLKKTKPTIPQTIKKYGYAK